MLTKTTRPRTLLNHSLLIFDFLSKFIVNMRLFLTPFDHIAIFDFAGLLTRALMEVSNQPLEFPGFRENLAGGALQFVHFFRLQHK